MFIRTVAPFVRSRVVLVVLVILTSLANLIHVPVVSANGSFVVNTSRDSNRRDTVLTLREALMVANGELTTGFTSEEQAQLGGCIFSATTIVGGCGVHVPDRITFVSTLGQINLVDELY